MPGSMWIGAAAAAATIGTGGNMTASDLETALAKGDVTIDSTINGSGTSGNVEVDDAVFAARVNKTLLYQMVKVQLSQRRRGSASTKTRADVAGSGVVV